jgi:hypothetical protein
MEIKKETMDNLCKFLKQISFIHHEHEGVHIDGCEACQAGELLKEIKEDKQLILDKKE